MESNARSGRYGKTHGAKEIISLDVGVVPGDEEAFRRRVELRLNVPTSELRREIDEFGCDEPSVTDGTHSSSFALDRAGGETVHYVWIPKFHNDRESLENLAYESLNVARAIVQDLGIRVGASSSSIVDVMYGAENEILEKIRMRISASLFAKALMATRMTE